MACCHNQPLRPPWRAGRRGFKSWACPNSKYPQMADLSHDTTQVRVRADVATTRRRRRRLRALPSRDDSDLDGPVTQVGRSERSCPVTQMDASSDEEVLHGRRVVPRIEHEFPPVVPPQVLSVGEGLACFQRSGEWE